MTMTMIVIVMIVVVVCCGVDDLAGWQDAVLKALEQKHRAEHEFLLTLMQDEGNKELREEARAVSEEDREKRIQELKDKHEDLDLGVKGEFVC